MSNPAGRIDRLLRGTPMQGLGNVIVAAGRKNGVSPFLITAIAGAESHFGQYAQGHNPFGWGPGIHFGSWDEAIGTVAHGLRTGYLDQGRKTVSQIGAKWAPAGAANDPSNLNSNWTRNVQSFLRKLGSGGGLGGAVSPSPALGGANTGSGTPQAQTGPDLASVALSNLGEIAAGKTVTPAASLASLVDSISASGGPQVDPRGTLSPPRLKGRPAPHGAGTVLDFAQAQIGQPYVWGGESRKEGGFDCSGLIQAAYASAGIQIPRTTWEQMKGGRKVGWNQLRPGDLVFANGGGHVVMYVGGGKVIAAPHRGTVVQYQPLSRFRSSFVGARRYL